MSNKSEIETSLKELNKEWEKCDKEGVPARLRKNLLGNIKSAENALEEIELEEKEAKSKKK